MELNLEQGYVKVSNFTLKIEYLQKVSKMSFSFDGHSLPLVCLGGGKYFFMYTSV